MNPHDSETGLIVASRRDLPTWEIGPLFLADKEKALSNAALIGKVTGHDSKVLAVRAQQELKRLINGIESARKKMKEPLLVCGRQLDAMCATAALDLEKEFGRVSNAVIEFDNEERRRVEQERILQQKELERIEREKQAELKRLADEQAAREAEARRIQEEAARKAREAAEAAAALEAVAKTKKQRELAERAAAEAKAQAEAAAKAKAEAEAKLQQERANLQAQASAIEEKASDAAYCTARPVEVTKVAGQRTIPDVEIVSINEWALAKARPDLIRKIEFDLRMMKEELKRGVKLPGVESREVFKATVNAGKLQPAIEV